jgi:hypothetical protein
LVDARCAGYVDPQAVVDAAEKRDAPEFAFRVFGLETWMRAFDVTG